jgi:hypothetical protein
MHAPPHSGQTRFGVSCLFLTPIAPPFARSGLDPTAVATFGSDNVSCPRGSSAGLTHVREEPVGDGPGCLAAGGFDADCICDRLVVRCTSGTVEFLRDGPDGLVRAGAIGGCE